MNRHKALTRMLPPALLVLLILGALLLPGDRRAAHAAGNLGYCPAAQAPALHLARNGDDLVITWGPDIANDAGYRVYRDIANPFFTPGTPLATLPAGSAQFTDRGVFATPDRQFFYLIEGVSSCSGAKQSEHAGVATYALNNSGGQYSLITVPFVTPSLHNASDLAAQLGNVSALLKWNPVTQGFRSFLPPNLGDDFELLPGDAVFVNLPASGPAVAGLYGLLTPIDHLTQPNGHSFISLPFQRTDLTDAAAVAADIGNVTTLLSWNEASGGFRVFVPPAGGDNFAVAPGDPFVASLNSSGPVSWPGEGGSISWSQTAVTESTREVLVKWQDTHIPTWPNHVYYIFRRELGAPSWTSLERAQFAASPTALAALLGSDLTEILSNDLRPQGQSTPLTTAEIYARLQSDPETAVLFATQYSEVAEAVGLAYRDGGTQPGLSYQYVVSTRSTLGSAPEFRPICAYGEILPFADFNLRESPVVDMPPGLGIIPSPRPDNAAERHDWHAYRDVHRVHGRAYLVWDQPPNVRAPEDPWQCVDSDSELIAGYHLYRRGPANGFVWEMANDQSTGATAARSSRRLLSYPAANPLAGAPAEAPYFFEEDVAELYPGASPADIFTDWEYRLCSVDHLGAELACSLPATVPIRELSIPTTPFELDLDVAPDHSQLTFSWQYNDPEEISPPLRFFVTRSPTMTLPSDQWTELTPGGIIAPAASPTFTLSLDHTPPPGRPFWYRVQARDNAGNWSAPSAPLSAGLFDRTPPSPPSVPAVPDCDTNSLPMNIAPDAEVRQLALYRAFEQAGPYQLIKRFVVEGPEVTIDDIYVPPDDLNLFYRLEAIDGNGNVSEATEFCTHHGNPLVPPPAQVTELDGVISWTIPDPDPDNTVTVTVDTPAGSTTITAGGDGSHNANLLPGHTALVTVQTGSESGESPPTTMWLRNINNFLNTNRHMAELGPIVDAVWVDNGGVPAIEITLESDVAEMPLVAAFRQAPGSNWMQVTPVMPSTLRSGHRIISDTADLSPNLPYSYTVMAFSPTSYEVLGYWDSFVVSERDSRDIVQLSPDFVDEPEIPPSCTLTAVSPAAAGLPDTLLLDNGWQVLVSTYYTSPDGGICPAATITASDLAGKGFLSNGIDNWSVDFLHIGINPATGVLTAGRITAPLGASVSAPGDFDRILTRIGFTPGASEAAVRLLLPHTVQVVEPGGTLRSNFVQMNVTDVQTNFATAPFTYPGALTIVAEGVPWQLQMNDVVFSAMQLLPGGSVSTIDRLSYPIVMTEGLPGNNTDMLRRTFTSGDMFINTGGLNGTFGTEQAAIYQTSLPGGLHLFLGASTLVLEGDRILNGTAHAFDVSLDYDPHGTVHDAFELTGNTFFLPCYRPLVAPYDINPACLPSRPINFTENRLRHDASNPLQLGQDGLMTGNLVQIGDFPVEWPQFELPADRLALENLQLFLPPLLFPEEDPASRLEPGAPMAAEIAWRQTPNPSGTGGELDPGINYNGPSVPFDYFFYTPSDFNGATDLYLRRGGISEQILTTDPGNTARTNAYLYQETVQRFEAFFLDNWIDPEQTLLETDLLLPYPSDVIFPLRVTDFGGNSPRAGETRGGVEAEHKFWDFNQSVPALARWDYILLEETVYPAQYEANLGRPPVEEDLPIRIFRLSAGDATVDNLFRLTGGNGRAVATTPIFSEWLPTGDYGRLEVRDAAAHYYYLSGVPYALSGIKLNHYYTGFLDTTSLPDTMGLELDLTGIDLPEELLDGEGALTPASISACSASNAIGCGFLLLDGNGAAAYYGEVEQVSGGGQAPEGIGPEGFAPPTPPDFLGDAPVGQWPVAVNKLTQRVTQITYDPSAIRWVFTTVENTINEICPFVFLPNDSVNLIIVDVPVGGVFACVRRDFSLLPTGPEIFHGDLGLVADFNLRSFLGGGQTNEIGIFLGYSGSQGPLRALAMNRPLPDGSPGVMEYTDWINVESDIIDWSDHFGYTSDNDRNNQNDAVDLAYDIWPVYPTLPDDSYHSTTAALDDLLRALNGNEAYNGPGLNGVVGLEAGAVLNFLPPPGPIDVSGEVLIDTGAGQAVFVVAGLDFRLEQLGFVGEVDVHAQGSSLLDTDWVTLEMNRDGEVVIFAYGIDLQIQFDDGADADLELRLWFDDPANERLEGSVVIKHIEMLAMAVENLNLVVGTGKYNNQGMFFIAGGARLNLRLLSSALEASFVYGTIYPESVVLRNAGYGHVLDMFASESIDTEGVLFDGLYIAAEGEFPIAGDSCLMEASAQVELRGWYFESPFGERYGGVIRGAVYGTFACIISAKGDLTLQLEKVNPGFPSAPPPGWGSLTRTCPGAPNDEDCTAFAGIFWVAIGIGFDCDPGTWKDWDARWWGDSWCWTFGAAFGLTYIDPKPGGEDAWRFDYDIDFE